MGIAASSSHRETSELDPASQYCEGLLLRQSPEDPNIWQQVFGALNCRHLAYYTSESEYRNGGKPLCVIQLANASVFVGRSSDPNEAAVGYPDGSIVIEALTNRARGSDARGSDADDQQALPDSDAPTGIAAGGADGGAAPLLIRSAFQAFVQEERAHWLAAVQIASREPWTADAQQPTCYLCDVQFEPLFQRRHHCRRCGQIVCSSCCTLRELPEYGYGTVPVRVCVGCSRESGPCMPAEEREQRKLRAEADAEELRRREEQRRKDLAGGATGLSGARRLLRMMSSSSVAPAAVPTAAHAALSLSPPGSPSRPPKREA